MFTWILNRVSNFQKQNTVPLIVSTNFFDPPKTCRKKRPKATTFLQDIAQGTLHWRLSPHATGTCHQTYLARSGRRFPFQNCVPLAMEKMHVPPWVWFGVCWFFGWDFGRKLLPSSIFPSPSLHVKLWNHGWKDGIDWKDDWSFWFLLSHPWKCSTWNPKNLPFHHSVFSDRNFHWLVYTFI